MKKLNLVLEVVLLEKFTTNNNHHSLELNYCLIPYRIRIWIQKIIS